MAGFKECLLTITNIEAKVEKEVSKYQSMNKNRNRTCPLEVRKREEYLGTLQKLFDISSPKISANLEKSRFLEKFDECSRNNAKVGYTRKNEDIAFLLDQRSSRKMVMGEKDISFEKRVDHNARKKPKGERSSKIEPDSSKISSDNEDEVDIEREEENKNNPKDRDVFLQDLNQFSFSRPSLDRKRIHNRSVNTQQEILDFEQNKPEYAALHWNSMVDVTGKLQVNEAILISGSPHNLEGKILCVAKLLDENDNPTSTGEAQAEAVLEQLKVWTAEDDIVALVYDTTASNSGVNRGTTAL